MQNKFDMYSNNDQLWCFQAPGAPDTKGVLKIEKSINNFISKWESHGNKVNARFTLWKEQVLIIHTELQEDTSGCSKDSLFQAVKNLLFKTGLDFMDRDHILWFKEDDLDIDNLTDLESLGKDGALEMITTHKDDFRQLVKNGEVSPHTYVVDSTLHSGALIQQGSLIKKFKDSWHSQAF